MGLLESNFRLLVEPVNNENSLSELTTLENPNAPKSGLDYETQIQVLKSPELMNGIINELQAQYPDISYDSLVNSLTIERFEETKIIEVSYRNNNPT